MCAWSRRGFEMDRNMQIGIGIAAAALPLLAVAFTWNGRDYNVPVWIIGALVFALGCALILTAKEPEGSAASV